MTTQEGIKQEDFIGQLLRLIQEGDKAQALNKILELSDGDRLDTIDSLVANIREIRFFRFYVRIAKAFYETKKATRVEIRERDHVSALTLALVSALDRARDRAFKLDRTLASALASDLTLASSFASSLAHAQDLASAVALASTIAQDLTYPYRLLSILIEGVQDLSTASYIFVLLISGIYPYGMSEEISSTYYRRLADALNEGLYLQHQRYSDILEVVIHVIEALLEGNVLHISLEGVDRITPDIAANQIVPYLQSLNEYLRFQAEITSEPFEELRIVQMHNGSPKIELFGVGSAIRAVKEFMQAIWMKDEDIQAKKLENERKRSENEAFRTKSEQEIWKMKLENANLEAETRIQYIDREIQAMERHRQARQELLEQQQREQEFLIQRDRRYLEMATEQVERLASHLPVEKRVELSARLALAMQQRDSTGLTGRFGSHDEPPPPPALPQKPDKS